MALYDVPSQRVARLQKAAAEAERQNEARLQVFYRRKIEAQQLSERRHAANLANRQLARDIEARNQRRAAFTPRVPSADERAAGLPALREFATRYNPGSYFMPSMTPEERQRAAATPDLTQRLIRRGNIGPGVDIGAPHTEPRSDDLLGLTTSSFLTPGQLEAVKGFRPGGLPVGEEAARLTGDFSPIGLAPLVAAPVTGAGRRILGAGLATGAGLGILGGAVEEAGFDPRLRAGPVSIGPRSAAELVGFTAGPALEGRVARGIGAGIAEQGGVGQIARRLVTEEIGGSRFQRPELTPARYQRVLADFAQAEEINPATQMPTIRPEELVTPEHAAVRNLMQQTGKTSDDLLADFATTRQVPAELTSNVSGLPEGVTVRNVGEAKAWFHGGKLTGDPRTGLFLSPDAEYAAKFASQTGGKVTAFNVSPTAKIYPQSFGWEEYDRIWRKDQMFEGYDAVPVVEPNGAGESLAILNPSVIKPLTTNVEIPPGTTIRNVGDELGNVSDTGGDMRGFEPVPEEVGPPIGDVATPELPSGRRLPRQSAMPDLATTAQRLREGNEGYQGAVGRAAGKVPGARQAVQALNPQGAGPARALVNEVGSKQADELFYALAADRYQKQTARALGAATRTAVNQEARRVGFRVRGGILHNKSGALGPVGDVFENPSKYALTPEQRQFADVMNDAIVDSNARELAVGVEKGQIFSDEGRYFPRQPLKPQTVEGRVRSGQRTFQRERFYEEQAAGIASGVNYESEVGALVGTRISAGGRAIADVELQTALKPFERTGRDAVFVPELNRSYSPEAAKAIHESLKAAPEAGIIEDVNALMRGTTLTMDIAYNLTTGLPSLWRNPAGSVKALVSAIDALIADSRGFGRYLMDNGEALERYIAGGGLWDASEMTLGQSRIGRAAKAATGRFDRAYINAQNVQALENFKGMTSIGEALGPEWFRNAVKKYIQPVLGRVTGNTPDEIAANISDKLAGRIGRSRLGFGGRGGFVESFLLLAPRYYRAQSALLGDALRSGLRGHQARIALASYATGMLGTYVAVAKATGQPLRLDPSKPREFLTWQFGDDPNTREGEGRSFGFGGLYRSMITNSSQAITDPESLARWDWKGNPAQRFLFGHASPLLRQGIEQMRGRTYLGDELDTAQQRLTNLGYGFTPLGAQTAIREGPESAAASEVGLRSYETALPPHQQIWDIPKYDSGKLALTPDESRKADEHLGEFIDAKDEIEKKVGALPRGIDYIPLIKTWAKEEGLSPRETQALLFVRYAEQHPEKLINPQWVIFALQNESKLDDRYPWMFTPQYMDRARQALRGAEQ